ncbi:flagellar hook-associated protein FlgL [Actinosynnema pretiosum subsp. pretiosum]|uniref:Flagellar hook-associated protein 3 n=2 Tax=Actinosynnema TaxID=40566 RepID=C6WJS3_ACTMD|nr:flagellar hook-associated protein FlgL [Actinosynnema mirum]ACU36298.1 flagellar hook-associated protein 3 [Actinosynnema mirum DSM 43827]AXX29751.1 Flagellar hook-associated protein FlgL [Actinosynnema pretiosum subsp. pretiosum]QUF06032.1 flagellar hook-associated protein FlgL [Actinosynnema pretiosum subsp. pretiosum]
MNISRVTERSMSTGILSSLQRNQNKMDQLREAISSGKQLTKPSDGPTDTVSAMQLRTEIAERGAYSRSAVDGQARLGAAETALSSTSDLLLRARDLVLQGKSAQSQDSREAIAAEIDAIRTSMIGLANTTYLDRPVFGGTTAGGQAFASDGSYLGDDGQVMRRIANGTQVRVDVPADTFGTGSNQVFKVLESIAGNMRSNPAGLSADLDRLDSGIKTVNTAVTGIGTRYGQLSAADDAGQAQVVTLSARLSQIEDVDVAAAVVELQTQTVAYEASLAATARIVQPSLLDFLR